MDMAAKVQDPKRRVSKQGPKGQDLLVFHLTGKRSGALESIEARGLRPALLARYRDLTRLRYDFPLVLLDRPLEQDCALSLSEIVNRMIVKLAPRGLEGERLRKRVLRLERDIRTQVAAGATDTLSALWAQAVERLSQSGSGDDSGDDSERQVLEHAGQALKVDGTVVDCNASLAARLLAHAWRAEQSDKVERFRVLVDQLVRRLSDILRAAFIHSEAGQRPDALRAAMGAAHGDEFDFDAMSRLVSRRAPQDELPPARRARIESALAVLRAQPFYAEPRVAGNTAAPASFEFQFDNCAAAAEAYRERLPRLVEVVKAMAVAELEADGRYNEAEHDLFFENYDENALTTDDLALFPDYFVSIPPDRNDAPENARLLDMLSSGLPVKVLVQTADLLEEASIGTGHFAFGVRSARLATTAMGLGGMFVMQAPSSNLYALRARIARGFRYRGPALFAVFAGTPASAADLSPYLTAAAALESRAFPTFTYDATVGSNWATRFSLENNRDAEADWPVELFEYCDETLQRVPDRLAFTYADFALCDRRYAAHFALVPKSRWNGSMVPAASWLILPERDAAECVPYLLAVDGEDRLYRVLVDARLMQAARRCVLLWHRLQEHAGIHDSHAERLLARERAAWEARRQKETVGLQIAAAAESAAVIASPAATAIVAPEPAESAADKPPVDEAWIETSRCPSCGECTNINDRMFAYNDNKQAYIKDIGAGTYRQLVEAAESCQVAIIHPGKPRNPNEPGLEESLERAKPFL